MITAETETVDAVWQWPKKIDVQRIFAVLQKLTEAILEYYFRFQFGNRRH